MSKHTPGPWRAGRPDAATYVDGVASKWIYADLKYVAIASGVECEWGEVMANARLIAAAPELLSVVRELLDMWLPDGERARVASLLARIDGNEEAAK